MPDAPKFNVAVNTYGLVVTAERDKEIRVGKVVAQPCAQYTYLGSPFTADGSIYSAVVAHAQRECGENNLK
ncbi:hypothetical protein E2C01_022921 [Portunus trituberculatus]|uniref:Uncharacterized protein n=1 Tax=Portunus trituberculatus TaxID=210409 RepID=A0A5B7E8L6_PORTR|nr:hypothetical protein [Portunus trituberculatus]